MMDFELKLEKPATKKAWIEGLVMGVAYFTGIVLSSSSWRMQNVKLTRVL